MQHFRIRSMSNLYQSKNLCYLGTPSLSLLKLMSGTVLFACSLIFILPGVPPFWNDDYVYFVSQNPSTLKHRLFKFTPEEDTNIHIAHSQYHTITLLITFVCYCISLAHPFTLTYPFTRSLTHSLTYPFTHSHSPTHTHSLPPLYLSHPLLSSTLTGVLPCWNDDLVYLVLFLQINRPPRLPYVSSGRTRTLVDMARLDTIQHVLRLVAGVSRFIYLYAFLSLWNWRNRQIVLSCNYHLISPRDKMAARLQTTFLNAFWWMKNWLFWFEFHWSLFLIVKLTINQHWFR